MMPSLNSYISSYFHNVWGALRNTQAYIEFLLYAGVCPLHSTVQLHEWRSAFVWLPQRLEQILTMSVSIHLLLGAGSVHMKRNLTSWKYLEAICEEALEL